MSGASASAFNVATTVFTVGKGGAFTYQMSEVPARAAGATARICTASFYFGAPKTYADPTPLPGQLDGPLMWTFPEWWGAVSKDADVDDTMAVQFALDTGAPVMLLRDYTVTRVTIAMGGVFLEGHNHALIGMAKVRTNAVVEVKAAELQIQNIVVRAQFNETYTAAMHWYTNQVNVLYVGNNRLRNIQFQYANIGLLIGAPPQQAVCCAWQGVTAPDGEATNAPLSESNMDGFLFYGCLKAIYYRQPNGFLEMSNSVIGTQDNEWPPGSFDWNQSCAVEIHHSGSLNMVDCDLEQISGKEWINPGSRIANITAGLLNMKDVTVESESSFHIGGTGAVTWAGNTDGGMNGFGGPCKGLPFFDVGPEASGTLILRDQEWSRGAGYWRECPTPFIQRTATAAYPDSTFRVLLDGVTLRDWTWMAVCTSDLPCGYFPVARGVHADIRSIRMTRWRYPGPWTPDIIPVLDAETVYPGKRNLLRAGFSSHFDVGNGCDLSGATVSPVATNQADTGGWLVQVSPACSGKADCAVYSIRAGLPNTTAGDTPVPQPAAAVRIASAAAAAAGGGWAQARLGGLVGERWPPLLLWVAPRSLAAAAV